MADSDRADVERTLAEHRDWLMGLPGVHAIWPAEGRIGVGCRDVSPEMKRQIQERVRIPVRFEEMGPFKAQGA